jgi:hypothetical protein
LSMAAAIWGSASYNGRYILVEPAEFISFS